MIINGGEPIDDCPANWDVAKKWIEKANADKDKFHEPKWSFDCGFKLDFDGPLISISCRFYPPKTNYGPKWDGICHIMVMGNEIYSKNFLCDNITQLHNDVEDYVKDISSKLKEILKSII
jgi:hypothetical protein